MPKRRPSSNLGSGILKVLTINLPLGWPWTWKQKGRAHAQRFTVRNVVVEALADVWTIAPSYYFRATDREVSNCKQ